MSSFSMLQELYHDDYVSISIKLGLAIHNDDPASINDLLKIYFSTTEARKLMTGFIAYRSEENGGGEDGCIMMPAWYATETSKRKALQAILKFTKDPDNKSEESTPPNTTLLMCAARTGDIETINILLESGADISATVEINGFIGTALGFAIMKGYQKTAEHLIANGAIFSVNEALGAVEAVSNFTSLVKNLILENPSLLAARGGPGNRTLLHHACGQGQINIVKWLVDNGADINSLDEDCMTPLSYAKNTGNDAIADYLVTNGGKYAGDTSISLNAEIKRSEITSIVEQLEVMEAKLGISLSSIYASLEKNTWKTPPDYEIKIQFDIMNSMDAELQDSIRIKAVAYNEAGQSVGQDDVIIIKDDFLGFDSKTISLTADQAPSRIRLFPVKL